MRILILKRDEGTCQGCGTTKPPEPEGQFYEFGGRQYRATGRSDPWDVDHIVRVKDGGTDDPGNLRLLCMPCHVKVGYEQRAASKGVIDLFGDIQQAEPT